MNTKLVDQVTAMLEDSLRYTGKNWGYRYNQTSRIMMPVRLVLSLQAGYAGWHLSGGDQ